MISRTCCRKPDLDAAIFVAVNDLILSSDHECDLKTGIAQIDSWIERRDNRNGSSYGLESHLKWIRAPIFGRLALLGFPAIAREQTLYPFLKASRQVVSRPDIERSDNEIAFAHGMAIDLGMIHDREVFPYAKIAHGSLSDKAFRIEFFALHAQ